MPTPAEDAVNRWKMQSFRNSDLPYAVAVHSLSSRMPMMEAKRTSATEWVVGVLVLLCQSGTNTPAVLCFAGIFADADDYLSGNLVMGDNEIPVSLEENRVERYANWKCAYSYAFNTLNDMDFYLLQSSVEEYMGRLPGFNVKEKPRRAWQSGNMEYSNSVFWMNVPMFIRRKEGERKPKAPDYLHPWVIMAEKKSRRYKANPARPAVRAIENGRLCDISQARPSVLREGDAVAVRFKLVFVEGDRDWYPQYHVSDVVRGPALADGEIIDEDAVIHEEDGTVGFTAETGVGDGEHVSTNGGVEAGVEAEAQALAGRERGSGDDIGVTGAERRDDTDVVIADVGARSSVGPSDMDVDESSSSPEWLSEKFVDLKASSHSSVDEDGSTVSTVSSLEDSSEGQSVGATNGRRKVLGTAVVRLKTTMGREECDDEGLPVKKRRGLRAKY
ncbi:hypothetical protein C8Q76DRAFT_694507 [Earliella scabrosa]|nr:hypothetical protein C8Q76DRAFT_694507 [Earliella scabrosa]